MKQDFTIWRNQILQNPRDISPLKFGISQDEVIEIFGNPDAVSTMRSDGKPLILKYHDIELHFDRKAPHGLYLVYSDDEIELSIIDHHEELLQPITNIEPVDNEFFLLLTYRMLHHCKFLMLQIIPHSLHLCGLPSVLCGLFQMVPLNYIMYHLHQK